MISYPTTFMHAHECQGYRLVPRRSHPSVSTHMGEVPVKLVTCSNILAGHVEWHIPSVQLWDSC